MKDDYVAFFVTVEVTENVLDVEVALLVIRRHLNCWLASLDEILERLLHNLKLTLVISARKKRSVWLTDRMGNCSVTLFAELLLKPLKVLSFTCFLLSKRLCSSNLSLGIHFSVEPGLGVCFLANFLFGLRPLQLLFEEFVLEAGLLFSILGLILSLLEGLFLALKRLLLQTGGLRFFSCPLLCKKAVFLVLLSLSLFGCVTCISLFISTLPLLVLLLKSSQLCLSRLSESLFFFGLQASFLSPFGVFHGSLLFTRQSFLFFDLISIRPLLSLSLTRLFCLFEGLCVFGCFCVTAPFLSHLSLSLFSSKFSFVAFSLSASFILALAVTITCVDSSLAVVFLYTSLHFCL